MSKKHVEPKRARLRWVKGDAYVPLYPAVHDRELWNLDDCISQFLVPRLKAFRADPVSYPMGMTPKRWDYLLGEMIYGFEFSVDTAFFDNDKLYRRIKRESKGRVYHHPEVKAAMKRAKNGRRVFANYFGSLWQ